MKQVDISIVIPCYNDGKYIRETIESVFIYNGVLNLEVIVVNDGSTDDFTLNELKRLEHEFSLIVINQSNKRMSAARNNGIKNANSSLILPLDADDILNVEFIDLAYKAILQDSKIGVVYGDCEYFGEKEGVQTMQFDKVTQWYKNTINITALIRKSMWEDCGGFDEQMTEGYEDWEFWNHALTFGWKFKKVHITAFKYRIKQSSTNSSAMDNHSMLLKYIQTKHVDFFAKEFINLHRENHDVKNNRKRLFNYLINNLRGGKNK